MVRRKQTCCPGKRAQFLTDLFWRSAKVTWFKPRHHSPLPPGVIMGSKPSPEPKILYMTPEKGLDKILELTLAAQNRPFQLPRGCQDEGEQAHVGLSDQLLARG